MKKKRFFIIGSISLVLGFTSFFLFPKILSFLSKNDVRADIPRVKGISDDSYDFEFSASSYKMMMGEFGGNPNFLIKQNSKEMEVTVFEGQGLTNIFEQKVEVGTATTSGELTGSPTPSLLPTPTDIPSEKLLLPEGLELLNFIDNLSADVQAQTQVASTSGNLDLVDTDTESSVVYEDHDLKVDPKLDKVDLSFLVNQGFDLPSLYLNLKKLELSEDDEGVTIKTRTGRNVFAYRNAVLTDNNGTSLNIVINFDQAGGGYLVGFEGYENWLADPARSYPVTLKVELVSLFAEKMLPFWPARETFKSFEPLVFEVDTAIIPDLEIQRSLLSDDLVGLKLGTINTDGEQEVLNTKVINRDGEKVTLELTPNKFKPGIFDLLIQYQSNPAYIAQDDFSWGVLAINPDMSVYPVGTQTKLDMAVLDKTGDMVCNADLLLRIENPKGVITEKSTVDGSIVVSDTCEFLSTNVPDYSTSYQPSLEGDYKLTLSALTKDGTFTIEDSFRVDSSSPFYVRRLGPTRIYPKLKYEMDLEITNASASGSYLIKDYTPVDFAIDPISGGQSKVEDNKQIIAWNSYFLTGEKKFFSYVFDAPDVSPELFLLGPLTIKDLISSEEVFTEGRSWQIASDAIGLLNSANSVTNGGTSVTASFGAEPTNGNLIVAICAVRDGASTTAGITTPSSDFSTAIQTLTTTPGQGIFYDIADSSNTEISITCTTDNSTRMGLHIYEYSGNHTTEGSVYDQSVQSSGTGTSCTLSSVTPAEAGELFIEGAVTNANTTFTNSSWGTNFTERSDFSNGGSPGSRSTFGSADFVNSGTSAQTGAAAWGSSGAYRCQLATFKQAPAPTGPTTAEVMRHGNWFSAGVEQYFFWAN